MGTISDKLTYLNTTKSQLKTMISYGYPLSNETFREYVGGVFKALINSMTTCENPTWNNLPKLTTTPGTTQSINNTTEAPMKIELGANELSQSATPTPSTPQPIHTITGENTITVCGKNLFDKNNYNLITTYFNGNVLSGESSNKTIYMLCQPNAKYTISKTPSKRFGVAYTTELPANGVTIYGKITNYDGESITITTGNDAVYLVVWLLNGNMTGEITLEEALNTLQIEKGSTATTYEPYKGNSYEINLGKNLFNPTETWDTWYGVECTINNQIITWDGTSSTGIARKICDISIPSGTYTMSLTTVSGTHSSGKHIYVDYMNGNTKIGGVNFTKDGSKTITLSDGIDNIKLGFDSADTFNNYSFKLQLEEGSTASSYSPYFTPIKYCKIGDYKDEFIRTTGKNLFDKSTILAGDIAGGNQGNRLSSTQDLYLEAGTYTFSCDIASPYRYAIQVQTIGKPRLSSYPTFSYDSGWKTSSNKITTFTLANGGWVDIAYSKEDSSNLSVSDVSGFNYQLEKGNITTPTYEPYGKNEWWLKKAIGKVVLDGSESDWNRYSSLDSANYNCFYLPITDMYVETTGGINIILSNYFKGETFNNRSNNIANMWGNKFSAQLYLKAENSITTTAQLQTWLSTHNTIVYYVLATPTYTKINVVDLVYQLEAISNNKTQNNQTNINQVNTDLGFILNTGVLEDLS